MYFELFCGLSGIIGSSYIIKKKYQNREHIDDEYVEEIDINDYGKSCPLIYFDKNGNYYYVYD